MSASTSVPPCYTRTLAAAAAVMLARRQKHKSARPSNAPAVTPDAPDASPAPAVGRRWRMPNLQLRADPPCPVFLYGMWNHSSAAVDAAKLRK